jgi:hypothetical protein
MHPSPIFTLSQSIPFYLKRSFSRSDFSPLISSKPPSPQEMEHIKKSERKEEEKVLKKKKERKKATRVSSNKRGSQYFNRRKTLQLQNFLFYMILFSPPPSYHFENLFQIIEKIFLTLFGPSFSLAIYMT